MIIYFQIGIYVIHCAIFFLRRERIHSAQQFYQMANFPGIIGFVDGTHVQVTAPIREEWAFVNRKSQHSINAQVLI